MDVRQVASLARLELDEAEIATFGPQLARVLEYVEQLGELDIDDLEPMAHAVEVTDVFRDDVPRPSLPREAALANAPKQDGRTFVVPAILDADGA
jgi:aspartyl-tRNA(Asn)/glutamyl-tRNA(Gln) amidotransferase subunit C